MPEAASRRRLQRLPLYGCLWLLCGPAGAQTPVTVTRADDQQTVPLVAYAPEGKGCEGVVLVSPGAGGSESGYAYLGQGLARLGQQVVVVGHRESGPQALRERTQGAGLQAGLTALVTDASAYRARALDIAAARAWAVARCPSAPLVLLGHSMGAASVMIEAGARNRFGLSGGQPYAAYVALSPQGPGPIFPERAWADIRPPVLLITGTRDQALSGESWETRTAPFADMAPGCKWLAVIDGATHLNLAGVGFSRRTETLVVQVVGAFLDGVRRGDCAAPEAAGGLHLRVK